MLICCLNFAQSFKACQSSLALGFICPTLPTLDDSDPGPGSSLSWTPRLSLATAQPSLHRSACTISLPARAARLGPGSARPASALARLGSARLGSAPCLSLSLPAPNPHDLARPALFAHDLFAHSCVCCHPSVLSLLDQVCLPIGSPQHALLATALCCHTHTIVACLHTTPGCDQACRSRQGLARPAQRALSAHASPNVFVCCLHPRTAQWAALGPALSAWPDSARHPGSPAHSRVCVLTHVCVCSNYVFALWIALVPLA
jgi:hypothetical protein